MLTKHSKNSKNSKNSKTSKTSKHNSIVLDNIHIDEIKKRVTRKDIRKFDIESGIDLINVLPKAIKFYKSLTEDQIIAVKYYKGYGSRFQTQIYISNPKKIEINFPFSWYEELAFRKDILGMQRDKLPAIPTLDIKSINTYIRNNYIARFNILNTLDNVFTNKNCLKLTGKEILYRGIDAPMDLKKRKVGDTYLFKNNMSTSLNRSIAENYTINNTLLVFVDLKDIPYIYIPNSKPYDNKIDKTIESTTLIKDLYEFMLPRNLEFKIIKKETGFLQKNNNDYYYSKNIKTHKQLINLLKKKQLLNTQTTLPNNAKTTDDQNNNNLEGDENTTENEKIKTKEDIIESVLFTKINIMYCKFVNWLPRIPLNANNYIDNANIIVDSKALGTWNKAFPGYL